MPFKRVDQMEELNCMYLPPDIPDGTYRVRSYFHDYWCGYDTILAYIIEYKGKLRRCSLQ